jgi:hypothetical protein
LTDEVWDHGSGDGEIFVVLRDGTSVDMEGYGERVSETDLWHLVNYLKSLAAAPATPAARGWMPTGVSSRAAMLRAPLTSASIGPQTGQTTVSCRDLAHLVPQAWQSIEV